MPKPAFFADLQATFNRLEAEFDDCAVVLTGTGKPLFHTSAAAPDASVIYVVCQAHVGPSTLDLGTIMITQGLAFASLAKDNETEKPVYVPYMIAELSAKQADAELWASASIPHPYSARTDGAGRSSK